MTDRKTFYVRIIWVILIMLLFFFSSCIMYIGLESRDPVLTPFLVSVAFIFFTFNLSNIICYVNDYYLNKKLDKISDDIKDNLNKNNKEINEKLDKIVPEEIKNNIKKCTECRYLIQNECIETDDGICDRK